jgi:hypothetical protein
LQKSSFDNHCVGNESTATRNGNNTEGTWGVAKAKLMGLGHRAIKIVLFCGKGNCKVVGVQVDCAVQSMDQGKCCNFAKFLYA